MWLTNRKLLHLVLKSNREMESRIMAAIDDLKAAVTKLNTSVSNELAAISAKLSVPSNEADVAAAATAINDLAAKLDAETAVLTAPAPEPPPAA